MKAFLEREVSLGRGSLLFLGSCRVGGRAWYFLRTGTRELALVAGLRGGETRAFKQGRHLRFDYRVYPEGKPTPSEAALLERFALQLMRREEAIARTLAEPAPPPLEGLPGPVERIREGDAERFVLRMGDPATEVEVVVGPRGEAGLSLFRWSAAVTVAGDAVRAAHGAAHHLEGSELGGIRTVDAPVGGDAPQRFCYVALGRDDERYGGIGTVRPGERLVLSLDLPSRCANHCLFCVTTACPSTIDDRVDILPELEEHLAALETAGRVDVVLGGRDALESPQLFGVLERLRTMANRGRLATVTPGTRLADGDFARRLAEAGLETVILSLLGPDGAVHDLVAGREGAFEDLCASVESVRGAGMGIELNTVLMRDNLAAFPGTLEQAGRFGIPLRVYCYVADPVAPPDQARRCAARYTDVVEVLEGCRGLVEQHVRALHYLPYCLLPAWARPLSSHGSQSTPDLPDPLPEPCRRCPALDEKCPSVGAWYLDLYGDEELHPVS